MARGLGVLEQGSVSKQSQMKKKINNPLTPEAGKKKNN